MISRFFTFEEHATLIEGAYHVPLVILSLMVAVFASYMAFNVAGQAAITTTLLHSALSTLKAMPGLKQSGSG